jgi:thioredoxin 1
MDLFKRMASRKQAEETSTDGHAHVAEPRHVSGEEFDTVILGSPIPAVVDFSAEWCAPCHAIAPSVASLAREFEGRVLVAKLDADEAPEIVTRYAVMSIPTVIYFQNGQEVDRVVGLTRYETLKAKVEKLL